MIWIRGVPTLTLRLSLCIFTAVVQYFNQLCTSLSAAFSFSLALVANPIRYHLFREPPLAFLCFYNFTFLSCSSHRLHTSLRFTGVFFSLLGLLILPRILWHCRVISFTRRNSLRCDRSNEILVNILLWLGLVFENLKILMIVRLTAAYICL